MRHHHIGQLLRVAREHRGISQAELARSMATQQSAVSELETGEVPPVITTFLRAMEVLDYDVEVTVKPRDGVIFSRVLTGGGPDAA